MSKDAQQAFLITALFHRYKLLTPAGLLKNTLAVDWDTFTEQVIKSEGKGILIQEKVNHYGTDPDLYFKTKHPLIAEELINLILPNKDKEFTLYERILKSVTHSYSNSFLISNLLKTLVRLGEFSQSKINKLHDIAYGNLSDDPHYLLNYAINLQSRNSEHDLKKGLELLVYAESLLEHRNHRFIHRRGVLNFELAKLYFKNKNKNSQMLYVLKEAKELFWLKQSIDSFSAYSYVDYIRCLIWENENVLTDDESMLQNQIHIEELLDLANRIVTDELPRIHKLQLEYVNYIEDTIENEDYYDYLIKIYNQPELRAYACILLFNYYSRREIKPFEKMDDLIEEMEAYMDNYEVTKFLFKYFGRRLYNADDRMRLFKIIKDEPALETDLPLQYNYFQFIAESYDHHFSHGRSFLASLKNNNHSLNPEFHYIWSDNDGIPLLHYGTVQRSSLDKRKVVKISSWQQTFRLIKGNYENFITGEEVEVKLHFYLYGIMAEIAKINSDE